MIIKLKKDEYELLKLEYSSVISQLRLKKEEMTRTLKTLDRIYCKERQLKEDDSDWSLTISKREIKEELEELEETGIYFSEIADKLELTIRNLDIQRADIISKKVQIIKLNKKGNEQNGK